MRILFVKIASWSLGVALLILGGCAEDQSAPQQQGQTFDWRGQPAKVDGSYEQSVQAQPGPNRPTPAASSTPGQPSKSPKITAAVLPSQALALLGQYLTAENPDKIDKMYEEFLAESQKKLLTKEEFKKRIQDNYYQILQMVMMMNQEEPRYIQQGHSADRKQCSFQIHWAKRPKPKNEGETVLWGVGFHWEKTCWKLEQFRPEILAPLGE